LPEIAVIGAVLWDIIGRAPNAVAMGNDVPGRIFRQPGGVALNIALALRRFGRRPTLYTAIGTDLEGDELMATCTSLGLDLSHAVRHDLPTDSYLAIEGTNGLIAAVADARGLEATGDSVLAQLPEGRGPVVVDGNLTAELLEKIATAPTRILTRVLMAPASPGKAERVRPFLKRRFTTLYLNREEAEVLGQRSFGDAETAARTLHTEGSQHVLVTDGAKGVAEAKDGLVTTAATPAVAVKRITGAGDCFMAAHLVATMKGHDRQTALTLAAAAAARHVGGEDAHESWIPYAVL
jgi:pseudouridine kinase